MCAYPAHNAFHCSRPFDAAAFDLAALWPQYAGVLVQREQCRENTTKNTPRRYNNDRNTSEAVFLLSPEISDLKCTVNTPLSREVLFHFLVHHKAQKEARIGKGDSESVL